MAVKGAFSDYVHPEAGRHALMHICDQGRVTGRRDERQLRAEREGEEKWDENREEERGEQKPFARLCGYLHGVILPV